MECASIPIFQANHTSSFLLLTVTRFYSIYPELMDHEENVFIHQANNFDDPFAPFNFSIRYVSLSPVLVFCADTTP